MGDVTFDCSPSGAVFPPVDEGLAAHWLSTGDDAEFAGGHPSDASGRLSGSYTKDGSNQGTGIFTWTWDLQPY